MKGGAWCRGAQGLSVLEDGKWGALSGTQGLYGLGDGRGCPVSGGPGNYLGQEYGQMGAFLGVPWGCLSRRIEGGEHCL
jgi:hypothetical protein